MSGKPRSGRNERILKGRSDRQVVLREDPERGREIVRRIAIAADDGNDLVDRADALGLIRGTKLPGVAQIKDRRIFGSTLEITEEWIGGYTLGAALKLIPERLTVNLTLSLVLDLARGLAALHSVREMDGRPAYLIHGRLGLDQVMISREGEVFVIGYDGCRGDRLTDVEDVVRIVELLLAPRTRTQAGAVLMSRLAEMDFVSADQLVLALQNYLERQDSAEIQGRRRKIVSEIDRARRRSQQQSQAVVLSAPLDDAPTIQHTASTPEDVRDAVLGHAASPDPGAGIGGRGEGATFGRYKVVASIGRGGMGEIYLARSLEFAPETALVALKVLGAEGSADDEALGMFIDEAAIMARIAHPNVLRVFDFGKAEGRYFLAMEYLQGRPLVRVMIEAYRRPEGLDYGEIAAIGADAAKGLHAAHISTTKQGAPLDVVHRDVSPQNIFLTYGGRTKVIDFGVARATDRISQTAVGIVKGKAAYMSPEQTEGSDVDARSDVFSLGVCLWEMTAGRRLFKRESEYDTLLAVASAPIASPTKARGIPDKVLDKIILGALERGLSRRTSNAETLAAQLETYARGRGIASSESAVRDLMERLFGGVALQERQLIEKLDRRAATEEEEESLRQVSGVSPRSRERSEITLVGPPAGLSELDSFGEGSGSGMVSTTASARLEDVDPDSAEKTPNTIFSPASDLSPEAASARRPTPSKRDAAANPPLPRPNSGSFLDRIGGGDAVDRELIGERTQSRPKPPQWRRREFWVFAAAATVLLGGAFSVATLKSNAPERSELMQSRITVEPVTLVSDRPIARVITATVVLARTTTTATATVGVSVMLADLEAQGLGFVESQGTYAVNDGTGDGTVVIDGKADVLMFDFRSMRGYLVRSKAPGLTRAVWIGSVAGERWRARGLSINDCAADVRILPGGITLSYPTHEFSFPHGGGALEDVSFERPRFANRLEIEPLGLAFGKVDSTRSASHCRIGWWGRKVTLRRLPPGAYTLVWIGAGITERHAIQVTASTASGAAIPQTGALP